MPAKGVVPARVQRAFTDLEFCVWIGQASPGEQFEYHAGFLSVDAAAVMSRLQETDRRRLSALAAATRRASDAKLVHLVQRRLGPNRFAYVAIARPKPRTNPIPLSSLLTQPEAA
ncbi:hypothetical protein [Aurantimonas sp. VKM B-3413]|uniref:hypothetical protein n=1 Tax=Aurantimonas sp. VKM B-3413 TaxID=2779401 RepID=UPI001E3F662E|nr:hypothetical protein [Aurantimonas sp. VKM B-3413]MCB8836165.1 hypothetical protein [Aurantimonas sp. VKM B-3413]